MSKTATEKKPRRRRICFKSGCRKAIKVGQWYCSRKCADAAKLVERSA